MPEESNWSFIQHITGYLSRPRLGDQRAPTQWPSEATAVITNDYGEKEVVGKCQRAAFFRLLLDKFSFSPKYHLYEPLVKEIRVKMTPPDPYVRWLWAQGDLYEDYCVNLAKESGVYIGGQIGVYIPEYNASGKIDLIVINPETRRLHITEVKSVYGYNANEVLGSPAQRRKGFVGTPRESNLIQIGLYQWWYPRDKEEFDHGFLTYGARDTGRAAEYKITVEETGGKNFICYAGVYPNVTKKVASKITIEEVLRNYKYIADCVDAGEIPPRSFELQYSEEKISLLCERDLLPKKDKEQHLKRQAQIAAGKSRIVKGVVRGDWNCSRCNFKDVCYSEDGKPCEL